MRTVMLGDAGVPMLAVEAPLMLWAIIPVVLLESLVMSRSLRLNFSRSSTVSFTANVFSSLLGIPLAWGLMLGIGLLTGITAYGLESWPKKLVAVTVQSAWLVPYEGQLYWMVPSATIFLLIPTFFLSVLIECKISQALLKDHAKEQVRRAVWRANLVSYAMLLMLAVTWLIISVNFHHGPS